MIVEYEQTGHIVKLTLNRPESFNSFTREMHKELTDAFLRFRQDEDAWVAIVTGAGQKAFSSGQDLKELKSLMGQGVGGFFAANLWDSYYYTDLKGGLEVYKPVIAAINGHCIGEGLTLALACDLRIAVESAKFAYPEVNLGLPTIIGAIRAPRVIGMGNALELLLLGETRDAAWAYRTGLVNKVVPAEKLMDEAFAWAERLCKVGPLVTRCTKEVAVRGQSMSFYDAIRMGEAMRRHAFQTEDAQEGVQAFLEKRPANFKAK